MSGRGRTRKGAKPLAGQAVARTDGACAGNPGRMGIGGVLLTADRETVATFSEPAGMGTNNEAEYLAVIRALELARDRGIGPLQVISDSQLVVRQLTGAYRINFRHLRVLRDRALALSRQIPDGVTFSWQPRSHNKQADALASRAAGMPQAPVRDGEVALWTGEEKAAPNLPPVGNACAGTIASLRRKGDYARFRDYAALRVGGHDRYSRAGDEDLRLWAATRWGEDAVTWLEGAMGADGLASPRGRTTLRWVARGLPPDMALKKVSVDTEIAANVRHGGREAGRAVPTS